jgi:RNA polymerase-binding transcription factor DksA
MIVAAATAEGGRLDRRLGDSMNAERTLEPATLLRELRAARAPLAAEGGADAIAEIAEIEAALDRAVRGTYGTCVACGISIAPDRLALLPATPYCRGCAIEHMHDPRHAGEHPTVAFGRLRGEQLQFFTDTELGLLLSRLLLGVTRHNRMLAIGGTDITLRATA